MEDNYHYIIEYLRATLLIARPYLELEGVEVVEHYLNHDEYEMACEGLFIELMKIDVVPPIDLSRGIKVCEMCKLNELTYFEMDFWPKLEAYVKLNLSKA